MKISDKGLSLIKLHEGLRLEAYRDSVGVLTIGYGHTGSVSDGQVITSGQAEILLSQDVHNVEVCVEKYVTVPMTQGEFDALCSFVFNLGCTALRNSTLLRKLNASDYDGAASEFKRWDHAGGQKLAGLTKRRAAEASLFESTVA